MAVSRATERKQPPDVIFFDPSDPPLPGLWLAHSDIVMMSQPIIGLHVWTSANHRPYKRLLDPADSFL